MIMLACIGSYIFKATYCAAAADSADIPRAFYADVGSYAFGVYCEVKLEDGVLLYRYRGAKPIRVTPSIEQWREFRKELDAVGIWSWHADYFNPHVFDGSQWRLEIEYADKNVKASGSNRWPDKDGVARPTEEERKQNIETIQSGKRRTDIYSTPTFDRYVTAIEHLLGDKSMR
jgi:hypothetical protein